LLDSLLRQDDTYMHLADRIWRRIESFVLNNQTAMGTQDDPQHRRLGDFFSSEQTISWYATQIWKAPGPVPL
jgi:hypothetical protein